MDFADTRTDVVDCEDKDRLHGYPTQKTTIIVALVKCKNRRWRDRLPIVREGGKDGRGEIPL